MKNRKGLLTTVLALIVLIAALVWMCLPRTLDKPNIITQEYSEYIEIFLPDTYNYSDVKGKIFSYSYGEAMAMMSDDLRSVEIYGFKGNKIIISIPDVIDLKLIDCPSVSTIMVSDERQKDTIHIEFYDKDMREQHFTSYSLVAKNPK